MRQSTSGGLLLGLATLLWGTALVAQRMGADTLPPNLFNAIRFLIGALTLVPLLLIRRKRETRPSTQPANRYALLRTGLLCGSLLFVTALLQQAGLATTTAGKAGFITSLYIVIVPALTAIGGKAVPRITWGCAALAMIGLYLLSVSDAFTLSLGDALILLCALTTSLHILAIDRFAPGLDSIKLSFVQFLVCGLFSLAASILFETISLTAIYAASFPILYTGILSCGVAYTMQIIGLKRVRPAIAVFIFGLEAVISVFAGWLVLGETLQAREMIGCAVILLATLLSQIPMLRRTDSIAPSEPQATA